MTGFKEQLGPEDSAPAPPAAGRFERRRHDRWPARGRATACCAAGELFGETRPLKILDESDEGLGARSDRPLAPGTVVTVGFAAPGHGARTGVVLRCLPCGDGYRLAIRFETRLAA